MHDMQQVSSMKRCTIVLGLHRSIASSAWCSPMRRSATTALQHSHSLLAESQKVVPPAQRVLRVQDFGSSLVGYERGLQLQQQLHDKRLAGRVGDTLLQLQHPPLYTLGKRGQEEHLGQGGRQRLAELGAEVFASPRGGEVTFHGPGQLVVYPIVNLRELGLGARAYVEGLEDVLIRTAGVYGVSARGRVRCHTGVWIGDRKLAAIGVRISQGITTHGVALNVSTDLSFFRHIVACGISNLDATSLERELRCQLDMIQVAEHFVDAFRNTFGYEKAMSVEAGLI